MSCLFDTALVHVLGPSASVDEAPMASFSASAVCWTTETDKDMNRRELLNQPMRVQISGLQHTVIIS